MQSALSIFWGVLGFAAMTVAAKQRWRYVWIVGVGLMVVVVAKLFLVDLSSIGTVARIASFLTVGLLLVITGYFAPLPPKREAAVMTRTAADCRLPAARRELARSARLRRSTTTRQGIDDRDALAACRWSRPPCRMRCIKR